MANVAMVPQMALSVMVIKNSGRVSIKPAPHRMVEPPRGEKEAMPALMRQSRKRILAAANNKDCQDISERMVHKEGDGNGARQDPPNDKKVAQRPKVRWNGEGLERFPINGASRHCGAIIDRDSASGRKELSPVLDRHSCPR